MNALQQLGRPSMGSGDVVIDPNDPPAKQAQIARTAQIVALLAAQLAPECSTVEEVAAAIKRCTDGEAKGRGKSDAWVADLGITADVRILETHLNRYDDDDIMGNRDAADDLEDDGDDEDYDDGSDGEDRMQITSYGPERMARSLFNATKHYRGNSSDARFGRLLTARGRGGAPALHQPPPASGFDFTASVASSADLLVEICKHLPFKAILNLYSTSRAVKAAIDQNPGHIIRRLADHHARDSARIFPYKCYPLCNTLDPTFRVTQAIDPRLAPLVPNIRYLGLVTTRERMVRDVLASMARAGEHLPSSTGSTLKKMWLVMDVPHNRGRRAFFASTRLMHNSDLYNMRALVGKLEKRCSDPLFGPCTPAVMRALLGQRSLSTLWAVLRARDGWRTKPALVRMKIRYDHQTTPVQSAAGRPVFGVPLYDVGTTPLEGWGAGVAHLLRPDELAEAEAARRGLDLGQHADYFLTWGVRRDGCAGAATIQPSADDMYMSDDDLPPARPGDPYADFGNVPFAPDEWRPHHYALRSRWRSLTVRDKVRVWADREEEALRALPWTDSESITSDDFADDMADVDDDDGDDDFDYGVPPQRNAVNHPPPPAAAAAQAAFATAALNQLPRRHQELVQSFVAQAAQQLDDEQEELKAQADADYSDADLAAWDSFLDRLGPNYQAHLHASAAAAAAAAAAAPPAVGAGPLPQQQNLSRIPIAELIDQLRLLGYDAENDTSAGEILQPGEYLSDPGGLYRALLLDRLEKEVFSQPRKRTAR